MIQFETRDIKELSHNGSYGFIITNPPYGERLEEKANIPPLYRMIGGTVLRTFLPGRFI